MSAKKDPEGMSREEIINEFFAGRDFFHVMEKLEPCDHEWNNGGHNPTECLKCGMDFTYYIHMECP